MTKKKEIDDAFSDCRDVVARDDPDRYLASLFAPRGACPAIWALLAFNQDVARVRDSVTDPNLGFIRLQWMREQIGNIYDGKDVPAGPVYTALRAVIQAHDLPRDLFDALIDAREFDLGARGPQSRDEMIDYADRTTTPLLELCTKIILPLKGARARRRTRIILPLKGGGGDFISSNSITPSAHASPSAMQGTSPFQGEDYLIKNIAIAYALVGLVRASLFHREVRGWNMIPPGGSESRIIKLAWEYLDQARAQTYRTGHQAPGSMAWAMVYIADIYAQHIEKAGFNMIHPVLTVPPPFLALRVWARVRGLVFFK